MFGGVAQSNTVGAGAALNFQMDSGSTIATSNADMTLNTANDVNISTNAIQDGIDIAVGVGAAKNSKNNETSTAAAVGGSFNVSVDTTSANSYLGSNAKIESAKNVNVTADNTSLLIKVAGGVAYSSAKSDNSVGAGIGANLNVLSKTTDAYISSGAYVNSSGDINVSANGGKNFTDMLISAAVAGAIVTGADSAYTFDGALGVDVIANTTSAYIGSSTSKLQ